MNVKPISERRTKAVQIRLTPAEKQELDERAKKKSLSVATYVRSALLSK